jgi:lysozyme family protein
MTTAFERAYKATHAWEKGYADHPADPGGKTMDGITERVFHAWLRSRGEALRPVRSITDPEKAMIYRRQYWDVVRGEQLPPGIDMAVFDFAVNSGPVRAIRYLQAVLGQKQDGQIGEVTLLAAREAFTAGRGAEIVVRYMAAREAFLRGLKTFPVFGKGWMNRLTDIGKKARAAANDGYAITTINKRDQDNAIVYQDKPPTAPKEPEQQADAAKGNSLFSLIAMMLAAVSAAVRDFTDMLSGLPVGASVINLLLLAVAAGAAFMAWQKWKGAGNEPA